MSPDINQNQTPATEAQVQTSYSQVQGIQPPAQNSKNIYIIIGAVFGILLILCLTCFGCFWFSSLSAVRNTSNMIQEASESSIKSQVVKYDTDLQSLMNILKKNSNAKVESINDLEIINKEESDALEIAQKEYHGLRSLINISRNGSNNNNISGVEKYLDATKPVLDYAEESISLGKTYSAIFKLYFEEVNATDADNGPDALSEISRKLDKEIAELKVVKFKNQVIQANSDLNIKIFQEISQYFKDSVIILRSNKSQQERQKQLDALSVTFNQKLMNFDTEQDKQAGETLKYLEGIDRDITNKYPY